MKEYHFRRWDSHETQQFYNGDEAFTKFLTDLEGASNLMSTLTMNEQGLSNAVQTLRFYKTCVDGLLDSLEKEIYERELLK